MRCDVQNYIPVLTSDAGSCLTAANWQEVNVNTVVYYLDTLLLKPGVQLLKQLQNFPEYMGWSGSIILNASRLSANKEGIFTLTSPYDGSKIKLSYSELFEIIQNLKPDAVILPKNTLRDFPKCWSFLHQATMPFIAVEDLMKQECHQSHGVYFNFIEANSNQELLKQVSLWSHLPRYVAGNIDIDLMYDLRVEGVKYIESDKPAQDAFQGQVYSDTSILDIRNEQTQMQFDLIEPKCHCPTCSQRLTKAYLHHLFLHTPLLCQRFLIQHNVFQAQKSL